VSAPAVLPRLLRAEEVAEQLGLSRLRVWELSRQGLIPTVKIGRSYRYDPQAVREWLDAGGSRGET
jgi:excisionase family DNA binding protein